MKIEIYKIPIKENVNINKMNEWIPSGIDESYILIKTIDWKKSLYFGKIRQNDTK